MKLDALSQLESPFVSLELPRFGEHADIILFVVVELDQRFDDMLPVTVNRAGAVVVRMDRVGNAAVKNSHAVSGSSKTIARKIGPGQSACAEKRAPL